MVIHAPRKKNLSNLDPSYRACRADRTSWTCLFANLCARTCGNAGNGARGSRSVLQPRTKSKRSGRLAPFWSAGGFNHLSDRARCGVWACAWLGGNGAKSAGRSEVEIVWSSGCARGDGARSTSGAAVVQADKHFDLSGYVRYWLNEGPKVTGNLRVQVDIDPMSFY